MTRMVNRIVKTCVAQLLLNSWRRKKIDRKQAQAGKKMSRRGSVHGHNAFPGANRRFRRFSVMVTNKRMNRRTDPLIEIRGRNRKIGKVKMFTNMNILWRTFVMTIGEAVNVMIGIKAKGSWRDISTFKPSLSEVKSSIPLKTVMGNEKLPQRIRTICQGSPHTTIPKYFVLLTRQLCPKGISPDIKIVGKMARQRVTSTRCHLGQVKLRKPEN